MDTVLWEAQIKADDGEWYSPYGPDENIQDAVDAILVAISYGLGSDDLRIIPIIN